MNSTADGFRAGRGKGSSGRVLTTSARKRVRVTRPGCAGLTWCLPGILGVCLTISGWLSGRAIAQEPPSILSPPVDQIAIEGRSATFSVEADGAPPLAYQWFRNGLAIDGANGESYTTPAVDFTGDGDGFTVCVSNEAGEACSEVASLIVEPSFQEYVIPIQPGFNLIANQLDTGDNSLDTLMPEVPDNVQLFKWDKANQEWTAPDTFLGGAGWIGPDGLPSTTTLDPGEGALLRSSIPFPLTFFGEVLAMETPVNLDPAVLTLVSRQVNRPGTHETIIGAAPIEGTMLFRFDPAVTDPAPDPFVPGTWTTYTFSKNGWLPGEPVARVGEPIFVLRPLIVPPVITSQPLSQSVVQCSDVTLSVAVAGTDFVGYQWRRNGADLAGATGAELVLTNVRVSDAGSYDVVVSSEMASTTSEAAMLTVLDPAPVLTCPANLVAEWTGPGGPIVDFPPVTVLDECDPNPAVVYSVEPGSVFPFGTTTVTVTATDSGGNSSVCSFDVRVVDTTPPRAVTCLDGPLTFEAGGRDEFTGPEPSQPRAELANAFESFPLRQYDDFAPDGVFLRSYSEFPECLTGAVLEFGLQAVGASSVGDRIELGYVEGGTFAPLWIGYLGMFGPNEERPLSGVPWVEGARAEVRLDLNRLPGGFTGDVDLVPTLAGLGALDVVVGNGTAVDFTEFTLDSCRSRDDLVVPADPGGEGTVVEFELPSFVDNYDTDLTVTARPSSGSVFGPGRTVVQIEAVDDFGNTGRSWFAVVVQDNVPPVLFCPDDLVQECVKPGGSVVFFEVEAEDNSGAVEVFCVPPSGSFFEIGTTPVTCTAVDAAGNSAECRFTVTLESRGPISLRQAVFEWEDFMMQFQTQRGVEYFVEYKDNLEDSWHLFTRVIGDGSVAAIDPAIGTAPCRFFRLRRSTPLLETGLLSLYEIPEPPPARPGTPEPVRPSCGPPHVYLHSGEARYEKTDLVIPGRGIDFVWSRKYRSCLCYATAMGWGWDYSYNICIVANGPDIDLLDGNTRQDTYFRQPDGSYGADQFFREGRFASDGRFVLTFADRGQWEFLPLDGTAAQGRISEIRDRHGNALRFVYNQHGQMVQVIDTLDRTIEIDYGAEGFLAAVTDFTGRQVRYTHYRDGDPDGSMGDLRSVTYPVVVDAVNGNNFPDGKTHRYTYTTGNDALGVPHLLLTVTNGKGQTWLRNQYAPSGPDAFCNRVVRQAWGYPDEALNFDYVRQTPTPENGFAVMKTIVNDRVGNVSECYFDAANRPVLSRRWTGRARPDEVTTDTSNRPGERLRAADPEFYETRWEWNIDSMPTRVVQPNGNSERNVYAVDLDPGTPRRSRGNLKVAQRHPGPMGAEQAVLERSFVHDSDQPGCCDFNVVVAEVDAKRRVTRHRYDEHGNRVETVRRIPSIVESFEYNRHGQRTARVWPDNGGGSRRRDTWEYHGPGPQHGYLARHTVDVDGFNLVTDYEYDRVGNLIRRVDPGGGDTILIVNALNQVLRAITPEVEPGTGIRYRRDLYYDADDNLVREDREQRDSEGRLRENTHLTTLFDFEILDRQTRVARERDPAALARHVLRFEAVPLALRDRFVTSEVAYDANRNPVLNRKGEATAGRDPFNVVRSEYDERDLLFRRTRGAGGTTPSTSQHDYDGNANETTVTTGLESGGHATRLSHDGYDRLVRRVDPMGNITEYRHDANGNVVAEILRGELLDRPGSSGNRDLARTSHVHDAMDRRVRTDRAFFEPATGRELDDGVSATRLVYSDNSQILERIDDRLNRTRTEYDSAHRIRRITDAEGNETVYQYDANGNVTARIRRERSDLGLADRIQSDTYAHDGLDRLIHSVVEGHVMDFAYDAEHNLVLEMDGRGNVTEYAFDGLRRLIETRRIMTDRGDGQGIVIGEIVNRQGWDDSSRLVVQVDDNGNETRYAHDSLDRRIATRMGDGTLHLIGHGAVPWPAGVDRPVLDEFFHNGHDAHDNPILVTDANGTVVATEFDALNRPMTRSVSPASGVLGATFEVFRHDGASRIVRAENDGVLVTRDYDSLGGLLRESINFDSPSFPRSADHTTRWARDGLGNALVTVYPGGRVVGRSFDGLNRVTRICEGGCAGPVPVSALVSGPVSRAAGAVLAEYFYLGPDRVEGRELVNGIDSLRRYDADGRLVETVHENVLSGLVLDRRLYEHDAAGNQTWLEVIRADGARWVREAEYDSVDRLARVLVTDGAGQVERDTRYTLDGVGNRLQVSTDPVPGLYTMNPGLPEPADFQVNQYSTTPFESGRSHDRNGNLIRIVGGLRPGTLAYDYRNRLVEARPESGDPIHDQFDALGRRVQRIVGLAVTRFLYGENEGRAIEEQDLDGVTLATYVTGVGDETVVSLRRGDSEYFVHHDDQGSAVLLADLSGAAAEYYRYGDFGLPVIVSGSQTSDDASVSSLIRNSHAGFGADSGFEILSGVNPFLFRGHRYDPDTGLYHVSGRALDSMVGRFLSRDPAGIWTDSRALGNGLTYSRNNPWRWAGRVSD